MGDIKNRSDSAFRDYVIDGVPASGPNDPAKFDIRSIFSLIDVAVYAAQAGIPIVANTGARDTFYSDPTNRNKLVYVNNNNGSATDPANGVYEYVGGPRIAQGFYQGLATIVQPLVDQARAAADDAEQAKEALEGRLREINYVLAPPGNGPLMRCDGLIEGWVGDLASWKQIDRPSLTAFNPSPIIAQTPGAPGTSDAGGIRECFWYEDTDGAWYHFYGAGNGSTTDAGGPWRPQYRKSTDRGLTWTTGKEVPGISLNHGYDSGKWAARDNLFVFKHTDGFYYFNTLTAQTVISNQVCGQPYTSDVWKSASIEGPYTYVGPTMLRGPAGRFDALDAYASCIVKNGSQYVMFYSATPSAATEWYVGMATSSTPYGTFTSTGTPVLPNAIRGQDENPEVFWHAGLNRWVMTTNSVSKALSRTDQNRVYFSTSLTDWSAATVGILQRISPMDGQGAIGHWRPKRLASGSVGSSIPGYGIDMDGNGNVPGIFDTDPTDGGAVGYHTGRRLKYAALEPSLNALAGKMAGGGTGKIRRALYHAGFVATIVVRPKVLGGTFDFGYFLQDSGDNADGYRVSFDLTGNSSVGLAQALSRFNGGTRTILTTSTSGVRAQAGLDLRVEIWVRGRHHRIYVDGELQLGFEDNSPDAFAFGQNVSLSLNAGADVELDKIRLWKSKQIVINGVAAGKTVVLRGPGYTPLAIAKSTGAQMIMEAPHYPASSVDADGVDIFRPNRGVWGGDVIDV